MKLYSRRMQIEQNFRDEKSERFGFALRASYSRSEGRMLVLSLLATLSTIVQWLVGYHAENKGLHLRYQANSIKTRRVISYLTLAENVLRHSPLILKRTVLSTVLRIYPKRDFGLYLIDSHAGVETLISGGFEHQGLLFNYRFLRLLR